MEKRINWRDIFPYTPRPEQVDFVNSIETANELRIPAILEGRNGLGKTLAALCGYLQYNRPMVYLTRTHQQIQHVCDELAEIQRTGGINLSAVVIGSRQRLCLNPHLVYESVFQKNPVLASHFCRNVFQSNKVCSFVDRSGEPVQLTTNPQTIPPTPAVCDVDTIKQFGAHHRMCPYYVALRLAEHARIVVSPFQYVINPILRDRIKLDIDGRVIIIDEAHSIPQLCCSILSKRITNYTVQRASNEAMGHPSLLRKITDIKTLFRRIPTAKMKEIARDKKYIFGDIFREILEMEGIGDRWIKDFLTYTETVKGIQTEMLKNNPEKCHLTDLIEFFDRLYTNDPASSTIMWETRRGRSGITRVLDYSCLDPSIVFRSLLNENTPILLMSGSISPRNAFQFDLGIEKAYSKEFAPLTSDNYAVFILRKYGKEKLTTSWGDRKNEQVVQKYGELVLDFLRLVPNASLIFFPSYAVKDAFLANWEQNGIYNEMRSIADLYYEEVTPEFEEKKVPEFLIKSKTHRTAMFAVTRGKISEGFDAPHIIHGIFVIGLPLANWGAPSIQAQIEYNNRARGMGEGNTWYHNNAMRWTNQNAGRGVRVATDFSAVFLVDHRFGSGQYYHKLSESVRNCVVKPAFLMDEAYAKEKLIQFFQKKIDGYSS